MKRILLTGITGQLGRELQQTLAPLGEVIGVDRQTWDLAQSEKIGQLITEVNPDLIVNAAAYTAVDKAETEIELVHAINGTAPTIMAEAAQKIGATLIQISTDYVFDGRKNTPYTEEDIPNPINAYGQSKLLGEQGVQHNCDRYIILRTSWVYGIHGKGNFVKTMLRLGAEREELRVVFDQVGTPTWTGDIARVIASLGQQILCAPPHGSSVVGIYHFTNSGAISWYDFAIAIFEEAQLLGFPLKVQRVVPITTAEYPTPATRPAYSVLSSQKISAVLGSHPPYWRNQLRQMLKQLYYQKVR
ncbi:MAG TPA: dTDP-4-dehydrorhamnose reductase [Cyanobacteria bacterium UBA8803]|nr:dTDP-4-dehydrorhamnose reductase [Cyanobacteria bacterium UBA9273]HBL60700.1 dTDP-4-dehydrorhamnose reductase [Cyanobacteria bacterium UBA8803]